MLNDLHNNQIHYNDLISYIRLVRTPNIGPITFYHLLKLYKTPQNAIYALEALLKGTLKTCHQIKEIYPIDKAKKEIEDTHKIGAKIITIFEASYPKMLRNINDSPPIITALGNHSLLQEDTIAIVGSRYPSINGKNFAYKLSYDISKLGFITVSGLAKGIDKSVHSVISKNFPTIAVMASGINIVYPKENLHLYKDIAQNGGLVLTELPFAALPKAQLFPQRNRIISGLSLGIVVVEASKKSGSIITANLALSQGREVFAVPGSPLDIRYSGCNNLIKNGAKLVESATDIIEGIKFNYNSLQTKLIYNNNIINNNEEQNTTKNDIKKFILQQLSTSPTSIEELFNLTSFNINEVLAAITELEISKKIEKLPNHNIALIL
ncbi:DNA-protecting protein DprA [Neoehrlichia mikurensis]|uniref:DNA-processing protein DprA n=1 Tax=Neoehrlichia mikurensis TaxID=89586 RepID=A0A9Q9BU51_9RICK|nr:DNA-processing protein DprA [Neoehrlichia mikurensis]QXK92118.1 DNA-protecting protein DprA [Neoehrlichia mikurensis]QXK92575.1 DNA-protecting protein DprA [Neoehrlichia mikurensis]QXK93812.1 DNA-protecting protein DprA [Neoehrlichia mikurensis]UTO55193.1 DNA-processing protein DprA [Neoehrlichia mikurensis]UTO56113.1 DNA-processing protein DprA [Neoehrlichia mikurensis]